jgi:hypothetical protein
MMMMMMMIMMMMMMMTKDVSVRSLKPWELYVQLYSRLLTSTEYLLQPRITNIGVGIWKKINFPNYSGLIHIP